MEAPPDLILLDIRMPEMDGYEMVRYLRADRTLRGIPVVFITGATDPSEREKAFDAGGDDYVAKPFSVEEVCARIRNHLRVRVLQQDLEATVRERTEALFTAYEQLKLEKQIFEWVVKEDPVGYLILNGGGTLKYANRKAREYVGLPPYPDPLPDEPFLAQAAKCFRLEPEEAWQKFPETTDASAERYLYSPETATSQAFCLQVEAVPAATGEDGRWLLRLRDATRRIQDSHCLWMFTRMVQHKLNTPLFHMTGLRLLAEKAASLSPEEVAELASSSLHGLEKLRANVGDILDFLDARKLTLESGGVPFDGARALAMRIARSLEIENLTVSLSPEDQGVFLPLSEKALERILWELLENTKKFHPMGKPSVELAFASRPPHTVLLRIQDDGIHVSPEVLDSLWAPFFQGEKYFTGQLPGMGLGLPFVASVVRAAGGSSRGYNRSDRPGFVVEIGLTARDE